MTATLDRATFFARVRKAPFGGSLTTSQVTGLDALLDMAPPDMGTASLAHCLAEAHHETGGAMIPRVENLNYTSAARLRQVWPKRFPTAASAEPYVRNPQKLANYVYGGRMGNTGPDDGWRFRGMGLVQATGRDNARRATKRLRDLGYLTKDQDLEATPTLMLDPDISAAMLFVGLSEGWYTGQKLSDFFGPGKNRTVAARGMVNPDSNGDEVAAIHRGYEVALIAAGHKPGAVTDRIPTSPIEITPLPAPGYASGGIVPAPSRPHIVGETPSEQMARDLPVPGSPIPPVPVNGGAPSVKPIVEAAGRATEAAQPPVQGELKTAGNGFWNWLKGLGGKSA